MTATVAENPATDHAATRRSAARQPAGTRGDGVHVGQTYAQATDEFGAGAVLPGD